MKISISVITDSKNSKSSALKRRTLGYSKEIVRQLITEGEFKFLKNKKEIQVGIRIAGPKASQILNNKYRNKKHATNVLSFATHETVSNLKKNKARVLDLGDIILSTSVITKDAKASGKPFYTQFFWTLSHGILHTLGYDHERSRLEAKKTSVLEAKLLQTFEP